MFRTIINSHRIFKKVIINYDSLAHCHTHLSAHDLVAVNQIYSTHLNGPLYDGSLYNMFALTTSPN